MRDRLPLPAKEVLVSLCLGLLMTVAVALLVAARPPKILVPAGLTMVGVVTFGSVVGMSLPFLLTRLHMGPAMTSAPLITSLADIGGALFHCRIATW